MMVFTPTYIDMIILICFVGEFLFDRWTVAKRYLMFWFWVDSYGNFPYAAFKYTSMVHDTKSKDDLHNFFTLNFTYTPRVYTICIAIKLLRYRKARPV